MVTHPVLAAIADHTQAVERGEVACTLDRCPTCGRAGPFKYHASRKRTFRLIVGRVVERVVSVLTRWRCVCCGTTLALYPDFALPHKRYVRQDIIALSGRYLSDDAVSYSRAVRVNGMPICYHDPDGHILWPSTVRRWIGFLGDLKGTLRQAWQLIRAKSPTCEAFRRIAPIPCWKYRGDHRKGLLQRAARLLQADREYRHLFGASIFTYLATVCGWS